MASGQFESLEGETVIHRGVPPEIFDVLDKCRTPTSKLVCLHLAVIGEATPSELKRSLGINLLTLYPILNQLDQMELFERDGPVYRCTVTSSQDANRRST